MRQLIIAGFLLSGCTVYRPFMPMDPIQIGAKEDPIALARGESSARYYFVFGPFGDDSTAAAIKDAVSSADADAMVNMVVERKVFIIPLIYSKVSTTVLGTAIKYKESPNFRPPPPPPDPDVVGYEKYKKSLPSRNKLRFGHGYPPMSLLSFEEWKALKKKP